MGVATWARYLFGAFLHSARFDINILSRTGYWLAPKVERVPDVSLIRLAKAAAMEVFHDSVRGAPDVAIEIIFSSESATELEWKVDQYLAACVLAVILIYPETRHVQTYRHHGQVHRLGPSEPLEIPELLPGFSLPIDELFATDGSTQSR